MTHFSEKTIMSLLKKHNIRPLKRLGQNFLIDENVLEKIIKAANLNKKDIVLEIGPGLGVLTIELAKRVKKIIAIEKDKRMYEILKENLGDYKNVEIINSDIMKYLGSYVGGLASNIRGLQITDYKLIANLPYYITSPVIRKFLEIKNPPSLMVLTIQKEVAQRICAKPPKMNLLAAAVQFYAQPEIISYVSKKSFYPQPKVDSAIIKITPHKSALLPASSRDKFFRLVKAGFGSKRKMLKNNLKREFKIKESGLEEIFSKLELSPKTRAENLSIKNWLNLFHSIDLD